MRAGVKEREEGRGEKEGWGRFILVVRTPRDYGQGCIAWGLGVSLLNTPLPSLVVTTSMNLLHPSVSLPLWMCSYLIMYKSYLVVVAKITLLIMSDAKYTVITSL